MTLQTFTNTSAVSRRHSGPRRGQMLVMVAILMGAVLMGIAAMSVDMSRMYLNHTQMQRAADAAALSGAYCYAFQTCANSPTSTAEAMAGDNGFNPTTDSLVTFTDNALGSAPINGTSSITDSSGNSHNNWYHVAIERSEPMFFGSFFGASRLNVSASATASYQAFVPIPISQDYYGQGAGGLYTYEYFGPNGAYSNGNDTATIYYDSSQPNPGTLNPHYVSTGVNFDLKVDASGTYKNDIAYTNPTTKATKTNGSIDGTEVEVQIYDPDETSSSNVDDVSGRSAGPIAGNKSYTGTMQDTTVYTLYYDKDGNSDNPVASDHVQIAQATYNGKTASSAVQQWVNPTGFTFDRAAYDAPGQFHINVTNTAGAVGNGFTFRAGAPHTTNNSTTNKNSGMDGKSDNYGTDGNSANDDAAWQAQYNNYPNCLQTGTGAPGGNGTTIFADSQMPTNIINNSSGESKLQIEFGYIPKPTLPSGATNAGTITISKFDTDVSAEGLYYQLQSAPGISSDPSGTYNVLATYGSGTSAADGGSNYTFQGSYVHLDSTNGAFSTDTIVLPTTFPGGYLYAEYTAGSGDCDEWNMSYSGTGQKGSIQLVQ